MLRICWACWAGCIAAKALQSFHRFQRSPPQCPSTTYWKTIACEVKRNCGRDSSSNEANITKGMPCVFSYNTHPQKGTFGIVMLACQGIINAFATAFLSEISPIDAPIPRFTSFTPRAQVVFSWASGRSWDRTKDCESLEYQQTRRVYIYI